MPEGELRRGGGLEVRDRGAPTGALRGLREPHPE